MESKNQLLNFCRNIQYLRKTNNLSRTKMAKILHISTKTLDSLERGVVPPHMGVIVLFYAGKYFHIHHTDLLLPREQWRRT